MLFVAGYAGGGDCGVTTSRYRVEIRIVLFSLFRPYENNLEKNILDLHVFKSMTLLKLLKINRQHSRLAHKKCINL